MNVPRRAGCLVFGALVVGALGCHRPAPEATRVSRGAVTRRTAHRFASGSYGRTGDLELENEPFGVLTVAAAPDLPGHRPMRGALVDVGLHGGGDVPDPLLAWRPGWRAKDGTIHVGPLDLVEEMQCTDGKGLALRGTVDGVGLDTTLCSTSAGYLATTTARDLPEGAGLADEVLAGTSHVLALGAGTRIEGDSASPFFATSNDAFGWLIESPQMHVVGTVAHIGEQVFQGPFKLLYPGARAIRTMRVIGGDTFDLLHEIMLSPLSVHVGLTGPSGGEPGSVGLLDGAGRTLALAPVPPSGRDIMLPSGFGNDLAVYDADGVLAQRVALGYTLHTLVPQAPLRAKLTFRYTDGTGAVLPVHVLLHGLGGTPDPILNAPEDVERVVAGRSAYLLHGQGSVAVAPGRYRVTATHGLGSTLVVTDVTLSAGDAQDVTGSLREVLPRSLWTSGDFHLHAAPSPDAPVSLDARVATLVCEGLDLAVATDHNRVTDYGPSLARLGVGARIVTVVGDEITSYGHNLWGHFNVYPLPLPTGAPEESASPYFDLLPEKIFGAAHGDATGEGARIVQVNHPRMAPSIGYFDLTHLDAKSGAADPTFSGDFDAVEAYNGFALTQPEQVRKGARDLVTLARRGLHVAATGNSDSHHLLYEEAGYPRTYVHVAPDPIATRSARVLEAIRRHDTTVTSGPLVEMTVDGAPIGSVVVPKERAGAVHVHVRVSAPAWVPVEHVEIWHDDEVAFRIEVTKAPTDGVRYEGDTTLAFPVDGTVLAWASADTPLPDVLPYPNARATGFTGLIYVDANGDGKVVVPARK